MRQVIVVVLLIGIVSIQHPDFLKDLEKLIRSTLKDVDIGSGQGMMSSFMVLIAIYFMFKKVRRHLAVQRIAGGVGLRLHTVPSMGWVVVEVVPGGSGDKMGLESGDCVTHVDGIPVNELKSFTVLRGPIGSNVTLRVQRGLAGSADAVAAVLQAEANGESQSSSQPSGAAESNSASIAQGDQSNEGEVDTTNALCEERIIVLERLPLASLLSNQKTVQDKKNE